MKNIGVVEGIRLFNDENPGGVQSANTQKGAVNKSFSSIVSYLVIRSPISQYSTTPLVIGILVKSLIGPSLQQFRKFAVWLNFH